MHWLFSFAKEEQWNDLCTLTFCKVYPSKTFPSDAIHTADARLLNTYSQESAPKRASKTRKDYRKMMSVDNETKQAPRSNKDCYLWSVQKHCFTHFLHASSDCRYFSRRYLNPISVSCIVVKKSSSSKFRFFKDEQSIL